MHVSITSQTAAFFFLLVYLSCQINISVSFNLSLNDIIPSDILPSVSFNVSLNYIMPSTSDNTSKCWHDAFKTLHKADRNHPEMRMNVSELISSKGYPCEDHYVQTEDGYILSMQRIPHGRQNADKHGPRPVAYLQHGLLGDATNWLVNLEEQSLGFILADAGYDVWLGNCRGTTYGKKHSSLSPDDRAFWDFSLDEMAQYDLPAFINYALNVSGQSQLYYIGHSQGTAIAFAAFSQNKELGKKVRLFTALAPVTTVGGIDGPLKFLVDTNVHMGFEVLLKAIGIHELLPKNNSGSQFMEFFGDTVCGNKNTAIICENIIFLAGGFDCFRMNATRLPIYAAHAPAGTSTKNIIHWAQLVKSGKFQMYDYGFFGNFQHYQESTAPEYDLSQMDVPVAIFSGEWDNLADPKDVALLLPKLKNKVYTRDIAKFDHVDFIWAFDAGEVLYNDVLHVMQKH